MNIKKYSLSLLAMMVSVYTLSASDTLHVKKDAYIRGGSHSVSNYGSETTLEVKQTSNESFSRKTFLQFDLSGYSSISSASLQIYGSAQQELVLSAYKAYPDSWKESEISWDNAPNLGSFIDSSAVGTASSWTSFDVTTAAQDDVDAGNKLFSIALQDDNELVQLASFHSKEHGMYQARLLVEGEKDVKDVFLVIGQSNTAGRAAIEAQDTVTLASVFLLDDENNWIGAKNPLNAYSTIRKDLSYQRLGYAYTFAQMMHAATGKEIGLVVNARGGSNLNEWVKGAEDGFFEEAYDRISTALSLPNTRLAGVLWHQGESNKNDTLNYLSKLETFIGDLRDTLGIVDLPFIAGQISESRPENFNFNQLIMQLPSAVANTACVESNGLSTDDGTHFDSKSQRTLGRRYASKMLAMRYGYTCTTDTVWVAEDAHVRDGTYADTNHGSEDLVRIKESASAGYTRRGYLKFDLSDIDGLLVDADLRLHGSVNDDEAFDIAVYKTTDTWAESEITWNNRPAMYDKLKVVSVDESVYKSYSILSSVYVFDEFVRDSTVSFGLKDNAVTTYQWKVTSQENVAYESLRPYLLVSYLHKSGSGSRVGVNSEAPEFPRLGHQEDLLIYPNPPHHNTFYLTATKPVKSLMITSLRGDKVFEWNDIFLTDIKVDLPPIGAGLYLIKVEDDEGSTSVRRLLIPQ